MQVWNAPEVSIELPYPPLDEHAEKCCDEDDAEAGKEERIDSDGIGRWREHWSNIWVRRAVLHDARLVEEDVLDGVERVWLEETEGLDEKCREEGGEECSLDRKSSQPYRVFLGLPGAYEDEDDIEEILPLAFAFVVFDVGKFEIVLPGGFASVYWVWKPSASFATGQGDLLSGASATGRGESISVVGIILYSRDTFFWVPVRCKGGNGIAAVRTKLWCARES